MKTEKIARVRYDEAEDSFVLEVWDVENKYWGFMRSARCFAAVNAPLATDFIHFSFMKRIVELSAEGYQIHFSAAQEG